MEDCVVVVVFVLKQFRVRYFRVILSLLLAQCKPYNPFTIHHIVYNFEVYCTIRVAALVND